MNAHVVTLLVADDLFPLTFDPNSITSGEFTIEILFTIALGVASLMSVGYALDEIDMVMRRFIGTLSVIVAIMAVGMGYNLATNPPAIVDAHGTEYDNINDAIAKAVGHDSVTQATWVRYDAVERKPKIATTDIRSWLEAACSSDETIAADISYVDADTKSVTTSEGTVRLVVNKTDKDACLVKKGE